jgi:hypothetical protein
MLSQLLPSNPVADDSLTGASAGVGALATNLAAAGPSIAPLAEQEKKDQSLILLVLILVYIFM